MNSETNKLRVPLALIWIVITYIEWHCGESSLNMASISWIVIFNLLFQTLSMICCHMSLVSFFYAFVFFYYIFHFGQVFITGLFPNYELDYLNYVEIYMTDATILKKTLQLCIVSINSFFIGGLLASESYDSVKDRPSINIDIDVVLRNIFIILLPFRLIVDGLQLIAAIHWGYYGAIRMTNMIPGAVATLANMWYASVPLYYCAINSSKKKKLYLVSVFAYIAITMLTGNRGHQIVCLASLIIVLLFSQTEIKIRTVFKYGILAVICMYGIDIVYSMRETSISDFLSNPSAFMNSTKKSNIFLETIGTFGETIYTPYLTISGCDNDYHTWFGEAFIKSIVGVIPDVFGWFRDINNAAIFPKNLATESAIGGSFCAEMYYNFKGYYPLMSALIGYSYYRISSISYFSIRLKRYENAIMPIVICSLALWWVRDSIGNLTRQVAWMYFIVQFFRQRK